MSASDQVNSPDFGLPAQAIRKRRRSRRIATVMLALALVTGSAGWVLLGTSISSAIRIQEQSPSLAIIAYGLLITSSVTLVLGLWYLLLAQVERLARIVDADVAEEAAIARCSNCGWNCDGPDRFCRHCGKGLKP